MVLLTISLAIHHRRYWIGSVAVGTVALFFRELALVYIGAMALAAWFTGRKREAFGWLFGCAVFLTGLAIHASIVSGHLSGDASGKSWLALGGWPFVLTTADWNFLLLVTPGWVTAIVAPLALVGAVAWRSHLGLQVSLILGGYFSAYMIVGNPDNDYWGILYAPFLALGLLYAVDGILDLWRVGRPAPEGAGD
jgi:hypothetical protein